MSSLGFPVLRDQRQPEVHASTLLLLGDTLLCSWFGGSKEGAKDTQIWLSATTIGSLQWEEPRVVADEEGVPHWNPVLFQCAEPPKTMLFYKVSSPISQWFTRVIESTDSGRTWSAPRDLVPGDRGGRGPVKNKPIVLPSGAILAPASSETADWEWRCFADVSRDGGRTWTASAHVPIDRARWPGEGAIQPSLLLTTHGAGGEERVAMLCRSSAGRVARADSLDGGETWSDMGLTGLANNNSGIDAVAVGNDTWLVAHNPVPRNWGPRTPLVVSVSKDQGQTWDELVCLENKAPPAGFDSITALDTGIENDGESEFSYPAIISDGRGGVFVSYTFERKGIKVVHLNASLVQGHQ